MRLGSAINSLARLAIVIGIVYAVYTWRGFGLLGNDVQAFAESACVDAIRERYDVSRVNPYDFSSNANGYVVSATATLSKGGNAKVKCLADEHGGVRDILISE